MSDIRENASAKRSTPCVALSLVSPLFAQHRPGFSQRRTDAIHSPEIETVAIAKFRRPVRAKQIENRLPTRADHVDMRGPMVIRIDDHAQATETELGRHNPLWNNRNA